MASYYESWESYESSIPEPPLDPPDYPDDYMDEPEADDPERDLTPAEIAWERGTRRFEAEYQGGKD